MNKSRINRIVFCRFDGEGVGGVGGKGEGEGVNDMTTTACVRDPFSPCPKVLMNLFGCAPRPHPAARWSESLKKVGREVFDWTENDVYFVGFRILRDDSERKT